MPDRSGTGSIAHGLYRGASYRIDRERRLIVITYIGAISLDDIRGIQQLSRQDPAFDPAFAVLLDGSRGDFSGLSTEDLQKVAQNTPMGPGARRAFVVNSAAKRDLVRKFGSVSEAQGRAFPFALFDNLEDAVRWLARRDPP